MWDAEGELTMAAKKATRVVVNGDLTNDWHLARVRTSESIPGWEDPTEACHQYGGAGLLVDLVKEMGGAALDVRAPKRPKAPPPPTDPGHHHSFAEWKPHPKQKGRKDLGDVWRVSNFLGVERPESATANPLANDAVDADVVVLDDADMGFRSSPKSWPAAIKKGAGGPHWVVVKQTRTVAEGKLWERLRDHHADRLIVVTTISDLRRTPVQISRALSWERSAQDLYWAFESDPAMSDLRRCAHVVVSFHTAGALLLSRSGDRPCRLFFDPKLLEGEWERDYPGWMIGYTTCLTAGIVGQLLTDLDAEDIGPGIQAGVAGMRALHREGYGAHGGGKGTGLLRFPAGPVAKAIRAERRAAKPLLGETDVERCEPSYARSRSRAASRTPEDWTILMGSHRGRLADLAVRIVKEGTDAALTGVPLGAFGNLLTVDRHEIEGFRSVGSLIDQYSRQKRPERPLSIAVFGPPGSGKSFGVKEVAKSVSDRVEQLTFNLSQLAGPGALPGALHQVRNVGIGGKLPLVFWDEFDTDDLAWLRHFLAPMQDASFQDGQITHPIGPAIFVFAGGTAKSMEEFSTKNLGRADLKVPDFVSRLKGFVDISGPDPSDENHDTDPYFVVRRAIVLRTLIDRFHGSLVGGDGGKTVGIDDGVLRAFLDVTRYRHGVRSIESILSMSELYEKSHFERSALPAAPQLNLHVDAEEFIRLVHSPDGG